MKRWWIYLVTLVIVGTVSPFSGTDVGQLQPVQLVKVTAQRGTVEITTDTGDMGRGKTVREAFDDLQQTSSKKIFMETAEYLLIDRAAETILPDITNILRPSCAVCLVEDEMDLTVAAEFLNHHLPELTLLDYCTGKHDLPVLVLKEERMYLVQ